MKRAIVIGSGAGGATVAMELQGQYDVTVVEAGGEFVPFRTAFSRIEPLRRAGLLLDARLIRFLFRPMEIRRADGRMILVDGCATGGTTTLSCANALRCDRDLAAIGINLDAEFEEIYRQIPVTTGHVDRWGPLTRRLYETFQTMDLHPTPLPKLIDLATCTNCGRCIIGCRTGAKWDSRRFLKQAVAAGAQLVTHTRVDRIVISGSRANGVAVRDRSGERVIAGDLVVVAAGGFGTPVILQESGIECLPGLSVDPVLCVAAEYPGANQHAEISMPFASQQDGYILSPYFDYLSFFFHRAWRHPIGNIVSLMVKLADSNEGEVKKGKVSKPLASGDRAALERATDTCAEVLARLGIDRTRTFLGILNAGHPGCSLPLTAEEAKTLHNPILPDNVYVADATILPRSLGNPPILTIVALAKRISRLLKNR
jgi:choline dehydrogenase-like flavoprotein